MSSGLQTMWQHNLKGLHSLFTAGHEEPALAYWPHSSTSWPVAHTNGAEHLLRSEAVMLQKLPQEV